MSFCVAGAALGAPQCHFAGQGQHLEHLSVILRGRRSTWSTSVLSFFCVAGGARGASPERSLEARRGLSTVDAGCVCVAGAALGAPLHNTIFTTSSTQHHLHYIIKHIIISAYHLHYIINTTSLTQPHQHITIYRTPSTQHHLHNIVHTTPSTLHHHILAGAALGALPCCPFCLIPADTSLVCLRCGLFFVLFR